MTSRAESAERSGAPLYPSRPAAPRIAAIQGPASRVALLSDVSSQQGAGAALPSPHSEIPASTPGIACLGAGFFSLTAGASVPPTF